MLNTTKKVLGGVAALAAIALGSSALAGAATSSSTTASTPSGTNAPARPALNGPAHGTAAHEDAEKAVTGSAAMQAQAAAVKSVGSGTAAGVTSDFTGKGYETTVTKADGTQVEVHLDSSFTVMQGPGGSGGPGGLPPGGPTP